ncbi:MAG: hypothetical protein JWQ27_1121 [Ferruginibacter sp.]|nr:hypothetical protein [Ferruginibacter sp.]
MANAIFFSVLHHFPNNIMKTLLFTTFTFLALVSFGQKIQTKQIKLMRQLSVYNTRTGSSVLKDHLGFSRRQSVTGFPDFNFYSQGIYANNNSISTSLFHLCN